MIPPNLTHAEVGALLMAVGQHMIDCDVCAEAVLAPDMLADDDYRQRLAYGVRGARWDVSMSAERANELLDLTPEEAIEFVRLK